MNTMLAAVAMLVTLGALSTSASVTASSEAKRDILGFRPGMSYTEATSLAAKVCKDKLGAPPWGDGNTPSTLFLTCSLGKREFIGVPTNNVEENLVYRFGNALPERSLISVSFHFAKRASTMDQHRYVAERFGIPVSCLSTNACLLNSPGLYLSFEEGKTTSTSFLFLIDNRLLHENAERWKQEHSAPQFGANGEEKKNMENSIVIFPPAAASTSSPNYIRKSHRNSSADREAPGMDFRDPAPGVPIIIREERR